jgi:predicted PurR-regulated permease PerM
MNVTLSDRERTALRWTILPLPIIAIGVALVLVANFVSVFSSILVMFFLAWLLGFLIDPVVSRMVIRLPFLPRGVAASLVFVFTVVLAIALLAAIASSVIGSLKAIIGTAPTIDDAIGRLLAPVQSQIDTLGFQINLTRAASDLVHQLSANASELLTPALNSGLQLFSVGTAIIFIAVVFVANKASFLLFAHRLVPADQRALYDEFVEATSRSFGGFIRGQFGLAALYGLIEGFLALVFGVPFAALILVVATALQSVPYFGQLVSWIPLVVITLIFRPEVIVPVILILLVLLLVVQNLVTPRVMGNAVGLNPVLVLAAVFIGAQVAGAFGAIFGVPVLAVGASLFDTWLDRVRPVDDVEAEHGVTTLVGPAGERTAAPGERLAPDGKRLAPVREPPLDADLPTADPERRLPENDRPAARGSTAG